MNLTARALAPAGARYVFVHSMTVAITITAIEPAILAVTGRYPGWDNGATKYTIPFSGANAVYLKIDREFPLGVRCMEVYGRHVWPSRYKAYKGHMAIGYSYMLHGRGGMYVNLFPYTWGRYLAHFSPRHRPKH